MSTRLKRGRLAIVLILCLSAIPLFAAEGVIVPANPNATPEAAALLKFIAGLSGKYTLTGQHNYPATKDRNTQFAANYIGKTPPIYSQDMGHAREGDTDSYLARPDIVRESIRQHQLGALVTLCWHAVPPTADEPITFSQQPGATTQGPLASVKGQLQDQQFKDLLTPGTPLYQKWCQQVDVIAGFLKQLQDAHVPVLWRPYHEMNGNWFWWGGRIGDLSTRQLYIQLYDRFTNYHKLNNLIWVWSVDRPNKPEMAFSNFFPGDQYVDILSLDVYGSDFNQSYYDDLLTLAKGKPVVLGEVGNPPTLDILAKQPNWAYWVIWAGMVRNTPKKQYLVYTDDPRILFLEDPAYVDAIAAYRTACGLPALTIPQQQAPAQKINLSGTWVFNEEKSVQDSRGFGMHADQMQIVHKDNQLQIRRSFVLEYADDRLTEETYPLDGTEVKSEFRSSPRLTTATLSQLGDTVLFKSTLTLNRGGQKSEMLTHEQWTLQDSGNSLLIRQTSTSPRGQRKLILVYDRKP